jgi:hypothetical protein
MFKTAIFLRADVAKRKTPADRQKKITAHVSILSAFIITSYKGLSLGKGKKLRFTGLI